MRTLATTEIKQVAGAITITLNNCYTTDDLSALHQDAASEATIFGIGAGTLAAVAVGALANYCNAKATTTGMAGAIAGLASFAYVYPAVYNSYELWPWNY